MSSPFFLRQKRILAAALTVAAVIFSSAPIVAAEFRIGPRISPHTELYERPNRDSVHPTLPDQGYGLFKLPNGDDDAIFHARKPGANLSPQPLLERGTRLERGTGLQDLLRKDLLRELGIDQTTEVPR